MRKSGTMRKKEKILVTGGLGFIGSHTVIELINAGYEPVIIDNLSNSEMLVLDRIERITGYRPLFYQFDICDRIFLDRKDIGAVIHFAAYKAVGESVGKPLRYFSNNLDALLRLLEMMQEMECDKIVFSSSATVYGDPDSLPVNESAILKKANSPYGSTKQMGEEILEKTAAAGAIKAIALRYFNPVGAHPSGLIGEMPKGVPNNLMPFIAQAASGRLKKLTVFGNDYQTPDGTCVRDYIHVVDLARAHVKACNRLLKNKMATDFEVFNIGTGKGFSVLEVIRIFEERNKVKVPYHMGPRRPGDIAENYADVTKALKQLRWKAELGIEDMVKDTWRWQTKNKKIFADL
jgi:UDP-glucose 4-epimerase